jgi:hypothetical protein
MFKTLLKHYIYEYCIDVTFNAIRKNFPVSQSRFYVGQQFDVLEFEIDDIWWSMELSEVLYCDDKLLVLAFSSSEVHIPHDHDDIPIFATNDNWNVAGMYGDEIGYSHIIYSNRSGGSQVFPIELLKDIDYV